MVGYFVGRHALPYWNNKVSKGRRTGVIMILMAAPMAFSGYLLQTAVAQEWRRIWLWSHIVTSVIWIIFVLGHVLIHILPRRKVQRGSSGA